MPSKTKKRKHNDEHEERPSKTHKHKKSKQGKPSSHKPEASPPPSSSSTERSSAHDDVPASLLSAFNSFASSFSSLLSYSQDDLQCLGEEKSNFVAALQTMEAAGELPWLSSNSAPDSTTSASNAPPPSSTSTSLPWPPPLPVINDAELLQQVYTHKSFIPGEIHALPGNENLHYERLEFLGDAWLQAIASQLLYERFPTLREGALTDFRQVLVCNKTLNEWAIAYNMQTKLREGKRQWLTTTAADGKILADCLESYIGAVVVDARTREAGARAATEWLSKLFEPKMLEFEAQVSSTAPLDKMARQELNRLVGGSQAKLDYKWTGGRGGNKGGYWITVYLTGWGWKDVKIGQGLALSKSDAQLRAAMAALANKELIDNILAAKERILGPKPESRPSDKGERRDAKPGKTSTKDAKTATKSEDRGNKTPRDEDDGIGGGKEDFLQKIISGAGGNRA